MNKVYDVCLQTDWGKRRVGSLSLFLSSSFLGRNGEKENFLKLPALFRLLYFNCKEEAAYIHNLLYCNQRGWRDDVSCGHHPTVAAAAAAKPFFSLSHTCVPLILLRFDLCVILSCFVRFPFKFLQCLFVCNVRMYMSQVNEGTA